MVPSGQVLGIVGGNGAGKSTLLRMIGTTIKPTSGTGLVGGFDLEKSPLEVRRLLGFLSSECGLYPRLTPRETLRYQCKLHGVGMDLCDDRIERISAQLRFGEFLDVSCATLSLGTKQKVKIARSAIHDPSLLVFDEATTGLDITSAAALLEFVRSLKDAGKTILFCTHSPTELQIVCDEIAILKDGLLADHRSIADFSSGDSLRSALLELIGRKAE
ncbi:ATP-binding cassette domain-containing protein [Roseiconus lacunae]|nr:ATP-binding cassette domain-containing protein [Roseiconus lacunae]MCD0458147.1 ATP-binding cassette domain-containing protein [Roseiconus lacunae]